MQGRLFTENFLHEGIKETSEWKSLSDEEFTSLKNNLLEIYNDFPVTKKVSEANTISFAIDKVVTVLG